MTFFPRLWSVLSGSFYGPNAYAAVRSQTFGRGVVYAFIAALIVSLAALVAMAMVMFPLARAGYVDDIANIYPDELEITFKDGKISTNVEEPYSIPFPEEWRTDENDPENLVVIDTKPDLTMDEIRDYDALAVVGESTVFIADDQSRTIDLSENKGEGEGTLTKSMVLTFAEKAKPYVRGLMLALPFFIAIVAVGFITIGYLLIALPAALIAMLIGKIRGASLPYGEAYIVSLYAMIPVAVFDVATDIAGVGNGFAVTTVFFALILAINLMPRRMPAPPTAVTQ